MGPVCEYVIAPVSRYAGAWRIPVLTAGAQADAFRHKSEHFPTLTRMMGSHFHVGEALRHILETFGWKVAGLLFHDHAIASTKGHSECNFIGGAIYTALKFSALNSTVHRSFNEETTKPEEYRQLLTYLSKTARSKYCLDV